MPYTYWPSFRDSSRDPLPKPHIRQSEGVWVISSPGAHCKMRFKSVRQLQGWARFESNLIPTHYDRVLKP